MGDSGEEKVPPALLPCFEGIDSFFFAPFISPPFSSFCVSQQLGVDLMPSRGFESTSIFRGPPLLSVSPSRNEHRMPSRFSDPCSYGGLQSRSLPPGRHSSDLRFFPDEHLRLLSEPNADELQKTSFTLGRL